MRLPAQSGDESVHQEEAKIGHDETPTKLAESSPQVIQNTDSSPQPV